jgi:putative aminopeptidase FrvX
MNYDLGESMSLPVIDISFLINQINALVIIPNPTGFTKAAINYAKNESKTFPDLYISTNRKGALNAEWIDEKSDHKKAITAHIDTLGAVVKEIKPNGRVKLSRIGSYSWNTIKVDVYPFYGSDEEAYWRTGGDVAISLVGPGVDASHNYERTHLDALIATTKWILAYGLEE